LGTWKEVVITHCVVVVVVVGRLLEKTKEEEQHLTVIKEVLKIHDHGSQKIEDSIFIYIHM
jgi:hypothetical protein